MSIFTIPSSQGGIYQDNRGELAGELYSTFNIDLSSKKGKISTSKKSKQIIDQTIHPSFNRPEDIKVYEQKYYLITAGGAFVCSVDNDPTDSANWSRESSITTSGSTEDTMDSAVFGGNLLISKGTDIDSWNGASLTPNYWTSISGTALTDDVPHILYSHRGGQETLFVTDDNHIHYYNATALHSTIDLDTTLTAACVAGGVSAVWVGTYSSTSDSAYVYEVYVGEQADGAPVARNAYKVNARAVLALEVIDNIPYIVTETGEIQVFNGAGFATVANFPFSWEGEYAAGVTMGDIRTTASRLPVHPNGFKAKQDSLYILINTEKIDSDDTMGDRSPSGLWEFNTKTGVLNHRTSISEETSEKGAHLLEKPGPLLITDNQYTFSLIGCVPTGTSGDKGALFGDDNANQGFGVFTTTEIESGTVQDSFESVYLKAKTLASGESIKIKYRTTKQAQEFAGVSFAQPNQINTTDTLTNVSVGNEVTVISGANAGNIAHITAITGSTTKSITLDTDIGTVGDSSRVAFEKWKLIDAEYLTTDGEIKQIGVGEVSPWIQYKVVMDGDIEFRQFMSKSNAKQQV